MAKPSKYQKILSQIYKNVYSKKWICFDPSCNENSINSHLLQQNGMLNEISENGHFIEVKMTDVFKWAPKQTPLEFKLVGISKAISQPLFCNKHDTSLFKEIESKNIDFKNYRSQLLFSYRTICSELRKKQLNIEVYERLLNSQTLYGEFNRDMANQFVEGTKLGVKDLELYKAWFEAELKDEKGGFKFSTLEYPQIKVYGSAIHSPVDYANDNPNQVDPLNSIFIHIIPYNLRLNVIVGYHKKYTNSWIKEYVNSWMDLDKETLEYKLNDLFMTKIESWGMSPKLYKNIPLSTKNDIMTYINDNAMNYSIDQKVNFNIFLGNNYGI
jgi:hypothetical protein